MGPQPPLKKFFFPFPAPKNFKYTKICLIFGPADSPSNTSSYSPPALLKLILRSPRLSRGLLLNYMCKMGINSKKYLNIRISNWYFSTGICRYWPMSMPIFESPSRSRGLLFNFLCWKLYRVKKEKLNSSPRLRLGDSKNSMDKGQYLHILVLEYQFDILIFRYFLEFIPIPNSPILQNPCFFSTRFWWYSIFRTTTLSNCSKESLNCFYYG